MPDADKTTIKIRAYSDKAENDVQKNNLSEDQNNALELANKNAMLAEEKLKSLELLRIIEQLRENLKQEQEKATGMEKRLIELEDKARQFAALEANAKRSAELEAKVELLTDALSKILTIASAGKAG